MQRKMEDLDREVAAMLRKGPLTPDEVSSGLGISWATANASLLRLASQGKATVSRKGRVNVFFIGPTGSASKHFPSWARPRRLEDLSLELSGYFSEGVSAAEMVRRERTRG